MAIVSTNAGAGIATTWSPPGSGSGGKSSVRSVRMWKRAVPPTISTSCSVGRSSSDTVAAAQRAHDVEQQPRRQHDRPGALDLAVQRDAQADLHVGGAEFDAAVAVAAGRDLHAGQRLHRAARGGHARDGLQLGEQLARRRRQLHDGHLEEGIRVIRAVDVCMTREVPARLRTTPRTSAVD